MRVCYCSIYHTCINIYIYKYGSCDMRVKNVEVKVIFRFAGECFFFNCIIIIIKYITIYYIACI